MTKSKKQKKARTMSISTPLEIVPKKLLLGFLGWSCIQSTAIFLLFKTIITATTTSSRNSFLSYAPGLISIFTFFTFNLSQLVFSASLSLVSSPYHFELISLFLFSDPSASVSANFWTWAKVSLSFVLFVAACAVSGFGGMVSMCWKTSGFDAELIGRVGITGSVLGLLYGFFYVCKHRGVLKFPIIQRPLFLNFKIRLPSAITQASKLLGVTYLLSAVLGAIQSNQFKSQVTVRKFTAEQIIFCIGSFAVFLCWELSHHLHWVLHTKRFIFAPPKGSAAAENNPSEYLLAALEESHPSSLLQYLAYLDLCMVCENNVDMYLSKKNNVDMWRWAAFFEKTGETYKRVIAVCLRPLEKLASELAEGLESSADKNSQLSNQLLSPTGTAEGLESSADSHLESKYCESLNNFQTSYSKAEFGYKPVCSQLATTHYVATNKLCAWGARAVASLTACSHREDRFRIARFCSSNAEVISALLSCLLAVETFIDKSAIIQSPCRLLGPAGNKWATLRTRSVVGKERHALSKARVSVNVLTTSIDHIVSAFHNEMLNSAKAGNLEKDWVISGKPLFGTHELLVQKLYLFLDFNT